MAALTSKQRSHLPFSEIMRDTFLRLLHQSSPIRAIGRKRIDFPSTSLNSGCSIEQKAWAGEAQAPWRPTRDFCQRWLHLFRIVLDVHKSRRDISQPTLHDPPESAQPLLVLTSVTPAPSSAPTNRCDFAVNLHWDEVDIYGVSFLSSCTENKRIVISHSVCPIWTRQERIRAVKQCLHLGDANSGKPSSTKIDNWAIFSGEGRYP